MSSSPIPADVRRFVLTTIPSIPFLEALLLFRTSGASGLGVAEVASHLYLPEAATRDVVTQLAAARLVSRDPESRRFHYDPADPELAGVVDRVADCYARQLIEMTHLIHSKTGRRAQQFADAFKLRKDE